MKHINITILQLLFCLGVGVLHATNDIIISDFGSGSYGNWKIEGTAFGTKPADAKSATQAGINGFSGKYLVHSYAGKNTKPTGTLTSPEFIIERDYINLLICGGSNQQTVGVKVLVEGKEVGRVTGLKNSSLDAASISVKEYRGKKAVIVIYDEDQGWWGYIAVDDIKQSDQRAGYERVQKKVLITGKLILLPVAKSGMGRTVIIEDANGVNLHNLRACLAQSKDSVAWWGYLEVDDYIGKTVTVSVDQKVGGKLLDMIECADEPRFLEPKYDEALRPQFHFSQLTGWNNDTNGLLWSDGYYHIFWQCNPLGTAWGNMYWGHAKSPDLVHWTEMKRGVRSGPANDTPASLRHPSMAAGACFSGGGNVDVNNTAGWKTGAKDVQFLLVSDMSRGQSIAYSVDGGDTFKFYEKNPVFKPQGNDGKPIWYAPGQHWVVVVYEKNNEMGEYIGIWTSKNLKDWERQSGVKDFHECPELFELPVDGNPNNKKWVIAGAKLDYLVGSFDGKKFIPDAQEKQTILTKERVYAGQSFSNAPGGRVIYTAWAKVDMGNSPFNNGFSIPMELTLKTVKGGRINIFANPVKEIETLRQTPVVQLKNIELNAANPSLSKDIPGQLVDACITLRKQGNPKEAVITIGGTKITYNFETEICGEKSAPMTDGRVKIRILIDRPTAEIFSADGYSYELMKRSDGGKNLGSISIKADAPQGSSVIVESLDAYPMTSIWQKNPQP